MKLANYPDHQAKDFFCTIIVVRIILFQLWPTDKLQDFPA